MPHQCVRCNSLYDEKSDAVIKGCKCGGKLFFFIKKERIDKLRAATSSLTTSERKQIEEDVLEIMGEEEQLEPVVLDLETVRILEPGKYELDLVALFNKAPLIYKIEDGKYVIDLVRSFGRLS